MPNLIGQSLGRYHILEQLGEGGMATVYKAYDTRLERDVAVKIIRTDQFGSAVMERILKRFDREAKALARLTHPNIVPVIDYGEFKEAPYLVMPYLPGGTLKGRLGEPMPWQEAVRILLPIAEALEYAHRQGVVHRDVKPSNILITDSGQPMLSDFGIAKILDADEAETLTGTGMGVGTPEYMAPEQWTGDVNQQADQYSLGVVFYEMVTGRKPFVADTPAALLLKQASDPLPRPRGYAPELPGNVEKVLIKTLAKKPEDRYPVMGALSAALEGLLRGSKQENASRKAPRQKGKKAGSARISSQGGGQAVPPLPRKYVDTKGKSDLQARQPLIMLRKYMPWLLGISGIVVLILVVLLAIPNIWNQQKISAPIATDTGTPTQTRLHEQQTQTLPPPSEVIPSQTPTNTSTATPTTSPTPTATQTAKPIYTITIVNHADGVYQDVWIRVYYGEYPVTESRIKQNSTNTIQIRAGNYRFEIRDAYSEMMGFYWYPDFNYTVDRDIEWHFYSTQPFQP